MGALLGFFGAAALAPGAVLRLKALVIGFLALVAVGLALTTWALLERSGKFEAKADLAISQAQTQVLSGALDRQTKSIAEAAKIGQAVVGDTRALLAKIAAENAKSAPMLTFISDILSKPPPTRADGKPKDCGDAWAEIRAKVQP